MSDTFQRGIIFATFFLSLLCGSLVCTSLVSKHWIEARLWRTPKPYENSGHVNFGLLHGRKELNYLVGLRISDITVSEMIDKNPNLMAWGLWCTTLVSTCVALLCTGLAALLAVVNSVTTPAKIFAIPGIYITNTLAFLMCLTSIITWSVQFHTKLYNNVLPQEDLDNFWTSEGASTLGFSFWLVVVAAIFHVINVVLIKWSSVRSKKKQQKPFNALEEKSVGAIMLY